MIKFLSIIEQKSVTLVIFAIHEPNQTIMKRIFTLAICIAISGLSFGQVTPFTVPMSTVNNATAFGANGTVGSAITTFYVHWDSTYLYLGWSGGRTNYSSDMYYAAIDINPQPNGGTPTGTDDPFDNVGFSSNAMDYLVFYENNSTFHGSPATNGNAFEVWNGTSGAWNFQGRVGGNDGTSSRIVFSDGSGEVSLRVNWASIGFTPGVGVDFALVMRTNSPSANNMWSRFPIANPIVGSTPKTLNQVMYFPKTGSGVNPSVSWGGGVLPVTLADFSTSVSNNHIHLNCTTASEINNSHFEIERSNDGNSWTTIGQVSGAGTTTTAHHYTFIDHNPALGYNYYRLKQVDFDGAYDYSEIVSAALRGSGSLTMSPNPVNDILYLAPGTEIRIFDQLGRMVFSTLVSGNSIDISNLPSGLYIADLRNCSEQRTEQLIKQ